MVKRYTFNGQTQSLAAWSRQLNIAESTLRTRLNSLNMSVEEAFGKPSDQRFNGAAQREKKRTRTIKPAPNLLSDKKGNAYVQWYSCGQRFRRTFGKFGTKEAVNAYATWCSEWYANQGNPPVEQGESISIANMIGRYLDYAEKTYVKNGKQTSEVHIIKSSMMMLNDLYGAIAVSKFDPAKLAVIQERLLESGKQEITVNAYINRIRRCFSWAVTRNIVPAAVADALAHLPGVRRGRAKVKKPRVTAAKKEHILAILPYLNSDPVRCETLATMVQLQLVTGMRPGDVLELRKNDINRESEPWLYMPGSGGKTLHLDKVRRVWFGPQARDLITPYLSKAKWNELLFTFKTIRKGQDKIKIPIEVYRRLIARACRIARVPVFTPNQIRHTRATELHHRYENDEVVASVLGNSPEVSRQIYIDFPSDGVAKRIAEECG